MGGRKRKWATQWANRFDDTSETASRKVILGKGLTTNTKVHPKPNERQNDKIRKKEKFLGGPKFQGKEKTGKYDEL